MLHRSRSLRLKLTVWYVLAFTMLQLVLVLGVVMFRRGAIRRSLDDGLEESAEAMIENIVVTEADLTAEALKELVPADSGFALFAVRDVKGATLASWNLTSGEELPFSAWEVVPTGPVGGVLTTIGHERAVVFTGKDLPLRIVTIPFRYRDRLYFLQAAVHDQVLERLFGPFLYLVVIGTPLGMLAAALAAWMIAGRAVAPIQRLSSAARRVSPTSLGDRFRLATTDEEIERLEDELNSALERLEDGYRAQEQFISNVSHELKTPIAVLLTESQVVKLGPADARKSHEFVGKVEREMKRLGKLVESFLILTRADLTKSRPANEVPMLDVALQAVEHCLVLARSNDVALVTELPEPRNGGSDILVSGDAELLQTMLENLIRNAILHSPPGASVHVRARLAEDELQIDVRDHGPGIPAEYLEKVFDRFVRVPRRGDRTGGVGLGLAIANKVVNLHGGKISVHNNEDEGCTFSVSLPLMRVGVGV